MYANAKVSLQRGGLTTPPMQTEISVFPHALLDPIWLLRPSSFSERSTELLFNLLPASANPLGTVCREIGQTLAR